MEAVANLRAVGVNPQHRRWVDEHGHVHFTVHSRGGDIFDVVLEQGRGGVSLRALHGRSLGYFYPDEDEVVIGAWMEAIMERKATQARLHSEELHRRRVDTCKAHHGYSVDLSCAETFSVLDNNQSRSVAGGIEVKFQGEWWTLARTDLKDDVCTTISGQTLDQYRDSAIFGARLKRGVGRQYFAVVDAYSDG